MAKPLYRVYGLRVRSDEALPGLVPEAGDAAADVELRLGPCPPQIAARLAGPARAWPAPGVDDPRLTTLGEGRLVRLAWEDGVAFVVARDGTLAWGRGTADGIRADLVPYLLGPVLGFVLRLRGRTALHASAVVAEGRALALAGASGTGKSTAAAALAGTGLPVLADDVLALQEGADGAFEAHAGPARILLWPEAVARLEGEPDAHPRAAPGWEKRALDLPARGPSARPAHAPLGRVFLLEPSDRGAAVAAIPVSGAEAVSRLAANAYGSAWLDPGMRALDVAFFSRLVARVPVTRLRFDPEATAPDVLARALRDLADPESDA